MKIMSLKICTDALLVDLVPPSRIASVTFMMREPTPLQFWPQGARIPVNHGTAEEILTAKPDLILTDPFMPPQTRALLARTGAKMVEVPPAEDFAAIRAVTRLVAKAVGEEARGEALVARMDADLAAMAARRPARAIRVAEWGGGGYVPGRGGLFDAMLRQAGAQNIEKGAMGYYDVEALIAARPDVLVYGDTYGNLPTLRDDQNQHPALLKRYAGKRIVYSSLYGCGLPETAAVARRLQAALIAAVPR
jgi:iron complex transport system substrate-binding protein